MTAIGLQTRFTTCSGIFPRRYEDWRNVRTISEALGGHRTDHRRRDRQHRGQAPARRSHRRPKPPSATARAASASGGGSQPYLARTLQGRNARRTVRQDRDSADDRLQHGLARVGTTRRSQRRHGPRGTVCRRSIHANQGPAQPHHPPPRSREPSATTCRCWPSPCRRGSWPNRDSRPRPKLWASSTSPTAWKMSMTREGANRLPGAPLDPARRAGSRKREARLNAPTPPRSRCRATSSTASSARCRSS